jgi:hypothetical protein
VAGDGSGDGSAEVGELAHVDAKQTGLLTDLHSKLVAGAFGETDVQSLITLLREESPRNGPIRELGDFAAHRIRNFGPVYKYIKKVKQILDDSGTQSDLLRIHEVFSESEIASAFDAALADHRLAPLSTQRHRQLQLVLISMLQRVTFIDESSKEKFGALDVTISRDRIELLGVVKLKNCRAAVMFPVLTVVNDCFPIYNQRGHVKAEEMLTVIVRDGVTELLGVKPYEIHIGRRRERGGAAPIKWSEIEAVLPKFPVHLARPDQAEFDVLGVDGLPATFKLRDGCISFAGRSEHFVPASQIWQCTLLLKNLLAARVYDDTGGYLFETLETLNQLEPA